MGWVGGLSLPEGESEGARNAGVTVHPGDKGSPPPCFQDPYPEWKRDDGNAGRTWACLCWALGGWFETVALITPS